jgi:hypothetical protein
MKTYTLFATPYYSVMRLTENGKVSYLPEETRELPGFESYSRDEWTMRTMLRFHEVSAECDEQLASDFMLTSGQILTHHAARLGMTRETFERLRKVQS